MSKAVLVMDMPETCNNCDFLYMAEGDLYDDFCVLNRINVPSIKKEKRSDYCPLKPLPEKQKLTFATHGEDMITMGWNAAIEAIEGG